MSSTGIGFIVHETGWGCSNDVLFDVEYDIQEGAGGEKNMRTTNTLKYSSIFDGVNTIEAGQKVECLFMTAERKDAFNGVVRGRSGDLTIVDIYTKSNKIQEIINKIKTLGGTK